MNSTINKTTEIIEQTQKFGANNYHPLPIVVSKAEEFGLKVQKETATWIC